MTIGQACVVVVGFFWVVAVLVKRWERLACEADDGQLTAGDIARIRKAAEPMLPKGKKINTRSLF